MFSNINTKSNNKNKKKGEQEMNTKKICERMDAFCEDKINKIKELL